MVTLAQLHRVKSVRIQVLGWSKRDGAVFLSGRNAQVNIGVQNINIVDHESFGKTEIMSNPNPKYKFRNDQVGEVARRSISVKLPPEVDAFVRSLPNRAEWLRQAIAAQVERDLQQERNGQP